MGCDWLPLAASRGKSGSGECGLLPGALFVKGDME